MVDLKNPFGLRNGKIITISDIPEEERGLSCDCVCPLCRDRFEARMGTKRRHHFAHNGEGCDQIAAYLTGLYMSLQGLLLAEAFPLPELGISFRNGWTPLTESADRYNAGRFVYGRNPSMDEYRMISKAVAIKFESTEIVSSEKSRRPKALLAHFHGRTLAFVIKAPDTVCKEFDAHPYQNMATVKIDLTSCEESIAISTTDELWKLFCDDTVCSWIYSPLVVKILDEINDERKNARAEYEKEQERLRTEREKEARAKQERLEAERKKEEEHAGLEKIRRAELLFKEREKEERSYSQWSQKKREQFQNSGNRIYRYCSCCHKECDIEDVFWGKKTRKYYCHKCIENRRLDFKNL